MVAAPLALLLLLGLQDPAPAKDEKPAPQEEPKPPQDMPERHDLPEDASPPRDLEFEAELRIGGWWIGGFNSTIPAGRRRIDSSLMLDAGLNLGVEYSRWSVLLAADYGAAQDLHVVAGSVLLGRRFAPGGDPERLSLRLSAGPLFGKLEADVDGFGNFKSAVGFEGRVDLTSQLQETIGVGFWLSYRQISFKFDEPVISGDTRAGGPGFAAGVGLLMRF